MLFSRITGLRYKLMLPLSECYMVVIIIIVAEIIVMVVYTYKIRLEIEITSQIIQFSSRLPDN